MVWNPEDCHQASAADALLCPQPCPPASSIEIDPSSTIDQSEDSSFLPDVMLPASTYPNSFINHTGDGSEYLMNSPDCVNGKDVVSHTMQGIVDNVNNDVNGNESWNLTSEVTSVLDNAYSLVTNDNSEMNFYELDKDHSTRNPRTRQDSTDSYDTVYSSSSGEIFNSNYTDTVSSVESTSFLLKPSSDSDEEVAIAIENCGGRCSTDVCNMSCSSSEVLNETESDEETAKDELLSDKPEESQALIEVRVESQNGGNHEQEELKKLDDFVPHPLVPIQENQVITFTEKEVQPTDYIKITNNVISVDESFLFHSNTSLWDLETGSKSARAVTMQNLHERSSFQDLTEVSKIGKACQKALLYLKDDINFGSVASINTIANKQMEKDPTQSLSLISGDKAIDVVKSDKHMRNLLALSFCLTLLYIAIGSVRNLQSSINHEGGVGVLSMATNSIGYTAGSLFSASIVLNFQPRKCIIVNLIPNLLYVASNIYPTLWLMIPISFLQGLAMAVIWNAVSTYVTFLSRGRTQKTGEATDQVSSRYFGILCLMYQSHLIIGNLIASLVLMPGGGSGSSNSSNETFPIGAPNATDFLTSSLATEDPNFVEPTSESLSSGMKESHLNASTVSFCGAKFCNLFEEGGSGGFAVSDETKYLLFGIYMGCILVSLLIAVFLLEPLNERLFMSSVKPLQKLKSQLSSLMSFFGDIKFMLLVPLLMYSVIQFGFITAEFTKAFVTCSLGIHMVGYTMICFGICGGISSYLSGLLTKFTGRIPLFIFAAITNLVLLIFMKQWQPSADSLKPFFIIMGVWGVSDGIWISSVSSLMGIIFPQRYEEAYAGLRIAQGVGPAIAFGYSSSLCMETKIYITVVLCVVSLTLYLLMEGLLKRKGKTSTIKFKQTSV